MAHGNYRTHLKTNETRSYDPFVFAQTVIEENHRMIHDGFMYAQTGKDTGWANAGVLDFLISVPAFTFPHVQVMKLNFGRGDIDIVAYEGTTTSNDGTGMTVQNVNRNSSNTAATALYASPTITDVGTQIFTLWVPPTGTGTGQSANGTDGVGQGGEWILAPETKYLVRLTNNSGSTIDWSHEFSWYEVDYT